MHIVFVYYSNTGHTASVAEDAASRLKGSGVETSLIDVSSDVDFELIAKAEGAVFLTPVNAFSLPQQMTDFFRACPAFERAVPTLLFINQGLWTPVLGGNRTARQLSAEVSQKGGEIKDVTIVSWNDKRFAKIDAFFERLSEAFA